MRYRFRDSGFVCACQGGAQAQALCKGAAGHAQLDSSGSAGIQRIDEGIVCLKHHTAALRNPGRCGKAGSAGQDAGAIKLFTMGR